VKTTGTRGAFSAFYPFDVRQIDSQHVAVDEQYGAQRLVLGGGRDAPVNGEVGEELPDVLGPISEGCCFR
jgi:hypothetical protein